MKIHDTLRAARPEQSMAPGTGGVESAAGSNLLPAAHAIGGRRAVSADRVQIDSAFGRPAPKQGVITVDGTIETDRGNASTVAHLLPTVGRPAAGACKSGWVEVHDPATRPEKSVEVNVR